MSQQGLWGNQDKQRWAAWMVIQQPGETVPDMTVSANLETKNCILLDAGTIYEVGHAVHEVNVKLNTRRKVQPGTLMRYVFRNDNIEGNPKSIEMAGIGTMWFRVR